MTTRVRKPAAKRTTKDFGATRAGLEKILTPYGKKLTVSRSASYGFMVCGNPTKKYPGGMIQGASRPHPARLRRIPQDGVRSVMPVRAAVRP